MSVLSEPVEHDVATLHIDTNVWHTITQVKISTSSKALDKLLKKTCSCSFREILFSTQLKVLDIRCCSIETQLKLLTQLASERFDSTSSASDACEIKCFFSSEDRDICISKWDIAEEATLKFKSEISQEPVDLILYIACLVTDHKYVKELMEKEPDSDVIKGSKKVLFYGISNEEMVNMLVGKSAEVNTKDARGRSPLFYALTTSSKSAKCLLDKGARVTTRDNCNVSVLTFFAENMMKRNLPPDKDEGLQLLTTCTRGIERSQMIKEIINLIFCKFIQILGTCLHHSNSQGSFEMLSATLKWILGENNSTDKIKDLINQLQSMETSYTTASNGASVDVIHQIFDTLRDLRVQPSTPDSEGNTCLHYATRLLSNGVPKETVMAVCRRLRELDVKFNTKNHKKETPLLFCLSSKDLVANEPNNWQGCLPDICKFLLKDHSELLRSTTYKEESVFHLTLKLCQQAILLTDKSQKQLVLLEMMDILNLFSQSSQNELAVNKRDIHLNSPLHLWASLALTSAREYSETVFDGYSFEQFLKEILDLLLRCGVITDDSNRKKESPLHVCRTWCAVKLLLEAEANPNVMDSSGRTPLLAAAKNNTCLNINSDGLYPDFLQDPKDFWKSVIDKKLDPWTADKNGESVLSILIEKDADNLAKALLEVGCGENYVQSDTIGIPLMDAICKDKSTDKVLKFDLLKTLLKSRRSLAYGRLSNEDTALHLCCRNMLKLHENSLETSVQWNIVQYILVCGANSEIAGETGQSCLDIAENCPTLKDLLSKPVNIEEVPPLIDKWRQVSAKHTKQLSMVARMVKCQQVEQVHFFHKPLDKDNGSFGFVFAGIDARDGREMAVKRIDKSVMPDKSGSESVLVPTHSCEQIVQYLFCKEDKMFYYIAFELMEGNLEDYLDTTRDKVNNIKLCKDVVLGLKFLHDQGIVHGSINPRNVFYQAKPNLCLKIGNCVTTGRMRGWVAAEDREEEMFSFGLLIHYLLSAKKHPFAPDDSTTKTPEEILHDTDMNVLNDNIVKLDDSLSPEATHLVQLMLDSDVSNRPTAAEALVHPFFWTNKTKKDFINVLGNEPEVAQNKPHPFTMELETRFNTIVTKEIKWNGLPSYKKIAATYTTMKIKRKYDYGSVASLIRFIRNAYQHINEQPANIQGQWEKDFVFSDYFPHLVIEVYKALTTSKLHNLHQSRQAIQTFLSNL